eukprot:scaffold278153_cov15-Tisochrysis_lutea.AAC.2
MKGSACACPHAGLEWMLSSSSELTWGVLHAALNGGLPAIDQSQREEVDANCWSSDQGQGHCLIARPGVFDWRLICFRFLTAAINSPMPLSHGTTKEKVKKS